MRCTIKCDKKLKNISYIKRLGIKVIQYLQVIQGTSIADNRPVQFMYNKVERQSNPINLRTPLLNRQPSLGRQHNQ